MRERKYVKFRVDMYADTKFKIIDMKPERDIIIVDDSIEEEKSRDSLQGDIPIMLKTKKGTKRNKKQKDEMIDVIDTDEKIKDNSICFIHDGVIPLREGETSILEWSFGGGS